MKYADGMLLLEGSRRFAPDMELEAGSKEKRGLEMEDRQAMPRKQKEGEEKEAEKKKKKKKRKKKKERK